jgi:hypothetical protein
MVDVILDLWTERFTSMCEVHCEASVDEDPRTLCRSLPNESFLA